MSPPTVRWGVIGPGRIAHRFADSLAAVPGARFVAAASRDAARAAEFVARHGGERHHGDYDALFADDGVDAVYIATPHTHHADLATRALAAGKAVLCEKPLTVNAAEAARVFDAARTHERFAMEAVWTRFLPTYAQVRSWMEAGRIGRVTGIDVWFGFEATPDPTDRLFRADLAGGALLDVGIYGVSLAQSLLRGPLEVQSTRAVVGETGVDEDVRAVVAVGPDAVPLHLHASLRQRPYNAFRVIGEAGEILVPDPFWFSGCAVLMPTGAPPEAVATPSERNGFEYQVREVQRCLAAGLLESPVVPWADTLEVMRCLDTIRARIGVRYPFEPALS